MTSALLLDTHIALWLDSGDERLRPSTRVAIDDCWTNGGTVFLSVVTAWEVAVLVDSGRIRLDLPTEEWIDRFLERLGLEIAALGYRTACRAYRLHHFPHRDPADRLLVSTAIELSCPLVTYDKRIVSYSRRHGSQDRFISMSE